MIATTHIMVGHVLDRLRDLPDHSVHMIWTSCPYWGLRDYGTEHQVWGGDPDCEHRWGDGITVHRGGPHGNGVMLGGGRAVIKAQNNAKRVNRGCFCHRCGAWRGEHGQEPTLEMWIDHELVIYRECARVLRKDGTLWINCGDAYSTGGNGGHTGQQSLREKWRGHKPREGDMAGIRKNTPGFKPKQRLMLPARLAIALQEDGWYLRDEIVWHKRNPMPCSVRDRTTPAHEMVYMFSQRAKYYYDDVAIREPASDNTHPRRANNGVGFGHGTDKESRGRERVKIPSGWETGTGRAHRDLTGRYDNSKIAQAGSGIKYNTSFAESVNKVLDTRNKRSVWSLVSEPFGGQHYATCPKALVAPCVMAGTSFKGVCAHCGAPWVRKQKDWAASCKCPAHEPIPATVLDIFGGAGTTGLVANELGRDAILIELNPRSAEMAEQRLRQHLMRVQSELEKPENPLAGLPLFDQGSI